MISHTVALSLSVAASLCKSVRVADNFTPTAPNLTKITFFESPPIIGIRVEWEPVEFDDRSPSSGYKVKMWRSKMPLMFKLDDVWITKHVPEESLDAIPSTDPVEQIVGIYETKSCFEGIELDVDYQVRVQAFDRLQHGPYSNALGIKLLNLQKPKEYTPMGS